MPLTGIDDMAMGSTCASDSAVRCLASGAAQGTSAAAGPPSPQSRRGSPQWMKVLYCQMSRWRHVRSRVS